MSITIVLENTSHPGNIGAVARAMYTMGLSKLMLINPCEVTEEAFLRARNGKSILNDAIITDDLTLLNSFSTIYGTTSRHRALNIPVLSSRELVKENCNNDSTAVLFGNETNGLSNELLNLCNKVIEIPAKPGCSLNLSHAAQIICYEIAQVSDTPHETPLANLEDREHFLAWFESKHQGKGRVLPHTMTRMRTILNKATLTPEELKLLYSVLDPS